MREPTHRRPAHGGHRSELIASPAPVIASAGVCSPSSAFWTASASSVSNCAYSGYAHSGLVEAVAVIF